MSRARDLFVEGMRAYQANDFGRAVTLLTQVDAIVPSAELAYNIAYCYQRMADPDHAVQFFRRYLETGSPSEAARTDVEARIAQMEALRARQRDATMALPPSMDAMTADAAALFASGQEMFRRRRYAPALQAFSAAAAAFQAVGVEVPELVYNLAVTSEHLRSLDDAADYYDEYLRQRPRDPEAERIRAHATELRQRRR
jgi:tetratricopeptide (TPR) repeat protein